MIVFPLLFSLSPYSLILEFKEDARRVKINSQKMLSEKIFEIFRVTNYRLQIFDQKFSRFVNVEELDEISDGCVLKIIELEQPSVRTTPPVEPVVEDIDHEISFEISKQKQSTTKPKVNWWCPYKVPKDTFPKSLVECLASKKEMTKTQRSHLWFPIYNDVTQYTYKMTSSMYQAIIDGLCADYPYLKGPQEDGKYPKEWRKKFILKTQYQYYTRNQKKRHDREVDEVR